MSDITRWRVIGRWARAALTTSLVAVTTSIVAATPSTAMQTPQSLVVDADPVGWTPHVLDGRVMAITQVGNRIVAGGLFTQVQAADGATVLTRNNIFAFDATTGAIDMGFVPSVDKEVSALAPGPDGASVFLGGVFTYVNGVRSKGVTKLSLANGQLVTAFKANTDNKVNDLKVMGNRVYIGGTFTTVGGVSRTVLAALDAQTGAVDPNLNFVFAGPRAGGNLSIAKLDITPDAAKLVAVGNFTQVDAQVRYQLVVLDLTAVPAAIANWSTTRYQSDCASVFDTYLRDIDIAPDGTYFVIGTTGGYRANTLCDSAARWELASTAGSGLQPTWIDFTGGDTTYSIAITGNVVYVGGHQRWWNNPLVSGSAGPGAVSREGIAALDPKNGLPLSWNPGRTRGVGAYELTATPAGLWVGSDTDRLAQEYHARIGFFPLFRGGGTTGTTLPATVPATLPRDLYTATRTSTPPALYRVNAGGATLASLDGGPSWAPDTSTAPYAGHNAGGATSSSSNVGSLNASVPATTPSAVFSSLRSDPSALPEMQWHFPVAAGTQVRVQLYFANRSNQTNRSGDRQFDVSIDGTLVLDNYDVVADVGNNVGVMKSFTSTSDGDINLDFAHVRSDPMISAVEILDVTPLPGADQLIRRAFDGASFGDPTVADSPATGGLWSHTRGAFMLNGRLYTGWDDGRLYVRTFDGTTLGAATVVDLHGLTSTHWRIANMTGMFYDSGRIYYTLAGDARLFYRYFSLESEIVGTSEFVASGAGDGFDWRNTAGMTLASGRLYYGSTDGNLRSVAFAGGIPLAGPTALVSGPATGDGRNWYTQELFVFHADGGVQPAPNAPPVAAIASSCESLGCTFNASGSTDPDGPIVSYLWDFGDGTTGTGAVGSHSYGAFGTYNVRLTVTDTQGAIAISPRLISLTPAPANVPPTAAFSSSCVDWSCTFNAAASTDGDGTIVSYSWTFGDGGTGSGPSPAHAFTANGTYPVALTVTDDDGGIGTSTQQVSVVKQTAVAFRAATSSNANATTHQVTVPANVGTGDGLLLFASVNATVTLGQPSGGWTLLDTVTSSELTTRVWQKVAGAADAGSVVTLTLSAAAKADLSLLAYAGTDLVAPVELHARAAETVIRTNHTTPAVVVNNPGRLILSYWSDKSASTTVWTPPSGQTVRSTSYGSGAGRVSSLVSDGGGPQPAGTYGQLTATTDSATAKATTWTIVLRPRP